MTDEEKKAIELLKKLQKKAPYIIWRDGTAYNKSNQIQTVLNLIEKQSKEIEELKKPRYLFNAHTGEITKLENSNCISKDKIKAKIKEYEDYGTSIYYGLRSNGRAFQKAKEILQSLLEEE